MNSYLEHIRLKNIADSIVYNAMLKPSFSSSTESDSSANTSDMEGETSLTTESSLDKPADIAIASQLPLLDMMVIKKEQVDPIAESLGHERQQTGTFQPEPEQLEPKQELAKPPEQQQAVKKEELQQALMEDSPIASPSKVHVEIFSTDGDLIVEVGTSQSRRIFKVHSQILSIASTRWQASITNLIPGASLQLHEEEPDAFTIAMLAAYFRQEEIPASIDQETLFAVMDMYSKYELQRLLKRQLEEWMDTMTWDAIEVELKVYWLLKDQENFKASWRQAVLHSTQRPGYEYELRVMERGTEQDTAKAVKAGGGIAMNTDVLPTIIISCLTKAREVKLLDLANIMPRLLNHITTKQICKNHICQQNALTKAYWFARRELVIDSAFPPNFTGTLKFNVDKETVEEAANYIRDNLDHGAYRCKRKCLAAQYNVVDEVCDAIELPGELAEHFKKEERLEPASKRVKLG